MSNNASKYVHTTYPLFSGGFVFTHMFYMYSSRYDGFLLHLVELLASRSP